MTVREHSPSWARGPGLHPPGRGTGPGPLGLARAMHMGSTGRLVAPGALPYPPGLLPKHQIPPPPLTLAAPLGNPRGGQGTSSDFRVLKRWGPDGESRGSPHLPRAWTAKPPPPPVGDRGAHPAHPTGHLGEAPQGDSGIPAQALLQTKPILRFQLSFRRRRQRQRK